VQNLVEMRERFATTVFFCLLSSLHWLSCIEDGNKNSTALEGRWDLVKGLRNQQETGTLSGTYFQFGADGKMITNLPVGPEVAMEYDLSQSTIQQKSNPPVEYTIRSISDTTLVLSLEMRGMQFELYLRRAKELTAPHPFEEAVPDQDTSSSGLPGDSEE
jgi:hypothetical protein